MLSSGAKVVTPATKGGRCRRQHLYCARQGATTTLRRKASVKPANPRGESPVNLKNLSLCVREYR